MFWIVFSLLVLLFTYLGQEEVNKKYYSFFRVLLVITLSYLIGFGGKPFTDHERYVFFYEYFDGIGDYNLSNLIGKSGRFEVGFLVLAKVGKLLGLGAPGFLFMVAAITNAFMVPVLYRFRYPLLSVLMFITTAYYSQQANAVRQMLAVAIILWSLKYLQNKEIKRYLICVFVASLFHTGAILLMIFALLGKIDQEENFNRIKTIILVSWVVSLVVAVGLLNFKMFGFSGIFEIYSDYSDEKSRFDNNFNPIYSAVLLYALFDIKKNNIVYLIFLACGCVLLNMSLSPIAGKFFYRSAYYFTPLFCFFTGELLYKNNHVKTKNLSTIPLVLITSYYIFRLVLLYIFNPEIEFGTDLYPLSSFFA